MVLDDLASYERKASLNLGYNPSVLLEKNCCSVDHLLAKIPVFNESDGEHRESFALSC
jgi:hypothetical protein